MHSNLFSDFCQYSDCLTIDIIIVNFTACNDWLFCEMTDYKSFLSSPVSRIIESFSLWFKRYKILDKIEETIGSKMAIIRERCLLE